MTMKHRRPRGAAGGAVPLFAHVAPEAKAVLDDAAEACGVHKWVVLEAILRHTPLDEHGRPVWWNELHKTTEEQPLKSA
ncbi:hypothetical protein NUM3379_35160 [Kineococcus sp. NUM-3379]